MEASAGSLVTASQQRASMLTTGYMKGRFTVTRVSRNNIRIGRYNLITAGLEFEHEKWGANMLMKVFVRPDARSWRAVCSDSDNQKVEN
jgi:hypothetical protein